MDIARLFRGWEDVVEHPAGTIFYSEQEPAERLFIILDGEVGLTLNGRTLGAETKGGIVGEMAMIDASVGSATAKAETDVRLARVDHEQLRALIHREPGFAMHLISVLANRLRAANQYMTAEGG